MDGRKGAHAGKFTGGEVPTIHARSVATRGSGRPVILPQSIRTGICDSRRTWAEETSGQAEHTHEIVCCIVFLHGASTHSENEWSCCFNDNLSRFSMSRIQDPHRPHVGSHGSNHMIEHNIQSDTGWISMDRHVVGFGHVVPKCFPKDSARARCITDTQPTCPTCGSDRARLGPTTVPMT